MSKELIIGFLFGIVSAFLSEYLLYIFKSKIYDKIFARRKYIKFLGNYVHDNGDVEIIHLSGNDFQATGIEKDGTIWKSNLHYLENLVFTGVYDWEPTAKKNDWGEHHLHILANGDISVIWMNKSSDMEKKGRLIWRKVR
jgi:hypothetical protein